MLSPILFDRAAVYFGRPARCLVCGHEGRLAPNKPRWLAMVNDSGIVHFACPKHAPQPDQTQEEIVAAVRELKAIAAAQLRVLLDEVIGQPTIDLSHIEGLVFWRAT